MKKKAKPKYDPAVFEYISSHSTEGLAILELLDRIRNVEDEVFSVKESDIRTTRAQQVLLLYHSGLFDIIEGWEINKYQKALFLRYLLNSDEENLEKDLRLVQNKQSSLTTVSNYKFLTRVFKETSMRKEAEKCETILNEIDKKR